MMNLGGILKYVLQHFFAIAKLCGRQLRIRAVAINTKIENLCSINCNPDDI